jgi:hypothetical protein
MRILLTLMTNQSSRTTARHRLSLSLRISPKMIAKTLRKFNRYHLLTLISVCATSWLYLNRSTLFKQDERHQIIPVQAQGGRSRTADKSLISDLRNARVRKEMMLDTLKEAWLKYASTEASKELVEISVDELGCSLEMVLLVQFLSRNSDSYGREGKRMLLLEISSRLLEGDADLREDIAGLPSLGDDRLSPKAYKVRWAGLAGMGCTEEQFVEFLESLDDGIVKRNAAFGQASRLSKDNPLGALQLAVSFLGEDGDIFRMEGGAIDDSDQVFTRIIRRCGEDIDLEHVIQHLPLDHRARNSPLGNAYKAAIEMWSNKDFEKANQFFLSNYMHLPPNVIGPLVWSSDIKSNGSPDPDWWNSLPRGEFYDEAVRVRTMYMSKGYNKESPMPSNRAVQQVELDRFRSLAALTEDVQSEFIKTRASWRIQAYIEQLEEALNN